MLEKILKLGHPKLHEVSKPVTREETDELKPAIYLMVECILAFRKKYGQGRAIAAPQIGVMKRLVVLNIDRVIPIFNPELFDKSDRLVEIWDDCMSFPELFVKVKSYYSVKMKFRNENWEEQILELEGDMAELLQHEVDHLNGILATMRAIDDKSFRWRE